MSYKLKGLFELIYVPMFSLNKKFHLPPVFAWLRHEMSIRERTVMTSFTKINFYEGKTERLQRILKFRLPKSLIPKLTIYP